MKLLKTSLMIAAATLALGAGIAAAAQDVVTLKVSHFITPNSLPHQKNVVPWCEKIQKESNGRLKCQIYPSLQLGGTPAQLFDQVRDGVSDIIWTVPTYQAGRFTKSEVFELPFMINKSEKGSMALWDYIHKNALDEFQGVKLIYTHVGDGAQMHFGSKSVKTLEDLKGLKIRVPTRLAVKAVSALGAIPVQMPMPAVPESIAKGVVDGGSLPWEITTAMKLHEICKASTEVAPHHKKHSNTIFVFAMNQKKYDSLPADLKKVIDNNSGREVSTWVGKTWDDGAHVSRKAAVDRKNTINTLSDAEYKRWVQATDDVKEGWIKEVNAKGGNGEALLKDAQALLKKYKD